jgi:hypothetical protein
MSAGQVEGMVSESQMLSRTIPLPIVTHYVAKIAALEPQILELIKQVIASSLSFHTYLIAIYFQCLNRKKPRLD